MKEPLSRHMGVKIRVPVGDTLSASQYAIVLNNAFSWTY
jgi:hypothetical protein